MDDASHEKQFVLACCKAFIVGDKSQVSKNLTKKALKSDDFLSLIRAHRLELVANKVISGLKIESSHKNYDMLKSKTKEIISNQLILRQALIEVHKLLKNSNIKHLFLKGPPLNFMLYGHEVGRYSKDIDLLVKPDDVLFIDKYLRAKGYLCDTSPEEIKLHLKANTKQDVAYQKFNTSYTIELHWKADYLDRLLSSKGEWVDDISTLSFCNQSIPILSPLKNVVYLCFHGAKHGWHRLFWLLDIVLFFRKYQIDVSSLIDYSKQLKMESCVFEMLYLSEALFDVCLDETLQKRFSLQLKDAARRCDLKARKMNRLHMNKKIGAFADLWHANYQVDKSVIKNLFNKLKLVRLIMTNITLRVVYKTRKPFRRIKSTG